MTNEPVQALLDRLFAEIEHSWRHNRDRTLVYRLSDQYPELGEELHEFFEDLVLAAVEKPTEQEAVGEERVFQWLHTTGLALAQQAASEVASNTNTVATGSSAVNEEASVDESGAGNVGTVRGDTWVAFIVRRTKCSLQRLAQSVPNATVEYLVLVSRHPDIVPSQIRSDLALQVETQWHVPRDESLEYLTGTRRMVRAASRSRDFDQEPRTFQEILDRASLTAEQRKHWERLGGSG